MYIFLNFKMVVSFTFQLGDSSEGKLIVTPKTWPQIRPQVFLQKTSVKF